LIGQVWTLVSGFYDLPVDKGLVFTKERGEHLGRVLYSVLGLRPVLYQTLWSLVMRNEDIMTSTESNALLGRVMTKEEVEINITTLQQYAIFTPWSFSTSSRIYSIMEWFINRFFCCS
jgi:ribosomal RNA-processing protein 12